MSNVAKRLPAWAQILPVYGIIVLFIYSWTLWWFFWRLPSWLTYLRAAEILGALAVAFLTNFVESLIVLVPLVLLALALPRRWFRDLFVARGACLALSGLVLVAYLADQLKGRADYPVIPMHAPELAVGLAAIVLLVYVGGRVAFLRVALEALADRAVIFIYVFIPLTAAALLYVLVRSVL